MKVLEAEPIGSIFLNFSDMVDYERNGVSNKTIIKKITGSIVVTSVAAGVELTEQKIPFDTYIQITEGVVEIVINNKQQTLESNGGIVVPAHSAYYFIKSNRRFTMIVTIIKSGYED